MSDRRPRAPRFRRFSAWPLLLGGLAALSVGLALPSNAPAATGRERLDGRDRLRDALHGPDLLTRSSIEERDDARVVGRGAVAWAGPSGEPRWKLTFLLARPAHLGLLRARWGQSPTLGVPTEFRWEVLRPAADATRCEPEAASDDGAWEFLQAATPDPSAWKDVSARPTRRSWFVDADACGLRLVVDRTNAGPPVVKEVQAIEGARNVLERGRASDDGAYPGFRAEAAIDGAYATRWVGAAGKARWTLRVDLPEATTIDRVRVVFGFDATSVPRATGGRTYAVSWAPLHYAIEASRDGSNFLPLAREPVRADGSPLPLRRRLVTLSKPQRIRALRIVMSGATGEDGLMDPRGAPVVREFAAFRADDERPVIAPPWILSVNANPSAQVHRSAGGEIANDAFHAKFLQARFGPLLPALRSDDRFARSLGPRGEWLDAPSTGNAGEALESIEGDDPQLDTQLLAQSSPPPIVVLSGSNDWDYDVHVGPDLLFPAHWHWDPLRDPRFGGMGQLADAVQRRVAPFLGFCGGAQILALLEARGSESSSGLDDLGMIDRVMQRTSGRRIRGFPPMVDLDRAWPTDPHAPRAKVHFRADDSLFADVAGPLGRSTTQALPEWHTDAIRPDAFLQNGPLRRFALVATSAFCAPDVLPEASQDGVFRDPQGAAWCATVPEAFRSRDDGWPVIGVQFHPEQRDFVNAAPGDPPESVADARLFLTAAYEEMVDAYERFAR